MPKINVIRYLHSKAKGTLPSLPTLAKALGIAESVATAAKDAVNNDGIYKISSGKGGGLSISGGLDNEAATYDYIREQAECWVKGNVYSSQGETRLLPNETYRKKLGGKWSNPDFTFLCVHKFLHTTSSALEVLTIEAKHAAKQFDVSCVYEALAHTRASHFSVLFFYDDPVKNTIDKSTDVLDEIKFECVRLGIGLVVSQYPCDISSWKYLIPAKRHTPDARRLDSFIEDAFDDDGKKWLKKAL